MCKDCGEKWTEASDLWQWAVGGVLGQHLELQRWLRRVVREPEASPSSQEPRVTQPSLETRRPFQMASNKGRTALRAGGLVLGKAEGTLLTGASLSRRTEAADGLALGCLAGADKIPQASEPLAGEGPWGFLLGRHRAVVPCAPWMLLGAGKSWEGGKDGY